MAAPDQRRQEAAVAPTQKQRLQMVCFLCRLAVLIIALLVVRLVILGFALGQQIRRQPQPPKAS